MKAILAAEDDSGAREVLKETLSLLDGCMVTAAENGSSLVELLDTVRPDLVVLDVNLPGISGLEVFQVLRHRADTATLPVLFVSALGPEVAASLEGTYRWLRKPYTINELLAAGTALLGLSPPVW